MARMVLNLKDAHQQRVIEEQGGTTGSTVISTRFPKRPKSTGIRERDFELNITASLPKLTVDVGDDIWDGPVLPTKTTELRGRLSSAGSYELTDSASHGRHEDNPMHHDRGHASRLNTSSFA
jgi:hypothetical protein